MTAPKIGGREMTVVGYDNSKCVAFQWRAIVGPFSVVVVDAGIFSSSIRFIQPACAAYSPGETSQEAADAASSYLRKVALEILDTVDPEAAGRAKCGTCRECKHWRREWDTDGEYDDTRHWYECDKSENEEPCLDEQLQSGAGFCHRFERKT